jgi:hypothetical protein
LEAGRHSTPRLWNRNFRVDLPSIDSDEFYADGLKDWLARSAPLPVPITWCGRQWEIISCLSLEEVLRIAPRWRSLQCLHFQWISPAWLVQRVAQCNLESLETLSLEVPRTNPGTALSFNPSPPKIGLRYPFSCIAHSDHAVRPTRRSDAQLQHVHKDGYYFRCPRPMPKSCQSMGLR